MKTLRLDGSIFFGSVMHIAAEIRRLVDDEAPEVKNLLFIARGINFIDVAGSEWLLQEARRWKQKGGGLYFAGLKLNAQETLIRGGFRAEIGEDHFFVSKEEALSGIVQRLNALAPMNPFFIFFWAALIFASIFWYGFLVFYVGLKAGREIRELTASLAKRE